MNLSRSRILVRIKMGGPLTEDGPKNPRPPQPPVKPATPSPAQPVKPGSDLPGDNPGNIQTEEAPPGSTSTTVPQQSPKKP